MNEPDTYCPESTPIPTPPADEVPNASVETQQPSEAIEEPVLDGDNHADHEPQPADEPTVIPKQDTAAAGADADALEIQTEAIVEAVLFATDSPLPAAKIAQIVGVGDARSVRKQIDQLNDKYAQTGASFRIEALAGGYQMLTLPAFNNWLSKLASVRRETRLSGAALETLAVVAYKQPIIRADIEAVRGVAVGDVLNRLREMGLVKIVGRAEVIGRPMLYGTTKKFLEVFGLASLDDLPKVDALALPASAPPAPKQPDAPNEPPSRPPGEESTES